MSKNARNALLALGAVCAVAFFIVSGGDDGYVVKAELANAGGLRKNSSVKIAGVPAGEVVKLDVTSRDTAIATMRLDEGAAPIGRGAKLNVRPTDLLGERYAEIKTGDIDRPLPSGSMIEQSDTATPVELDDILNMLDADTRQRLAIMINEVGVAVAGRGTNFNKLLAQLPPSLEETGKLLEQIGAENAALEEGAQRADRVVTLVNGRREDMGDLIREAGDALGVVADERAALGATIRSAPGALGRLRSTLATLDDASDDLRPAAVDLQRATAPLQATLEALPGFATAARPALSKAKDVSPALTRLARGATPTVKALAPSVRNVDRLLEPAGPILAQMDRRGWDDLLFFVNNFNRGLKSRDGIGHFIGAKMNIAAEYIDHAIDAFTNVPAAQPQAKKDRSAAPATPSSPAVKDTVEEARKPVRKLTDKVKGITDKLGKQPAEALEKVLPQIGNAVGGLLQGGKAQPDATEGSASGEADALRLFDYLMGQ